MTSKDIQFIVVHCSATKPSVKVDAKMIDRWHRQQGWAGIGYHFVIKRDGMTELGRGLEKPGAHALGVNDKSWGICLAGGLNEQTGKAEDNFTVEQYAALGGILTILKKDAPQAEILGHRDLPKVAKDCPCFDVRKWCDETGIEHRPE